MNRPLFLRSMPARAAGLSRAVGERWVVVKGAVIAFALVGMGGLLTGCGEAPSGQGAATGTTTEVRGAPIKTLREARAESPGDRPATNATVSAASAGAAIAAAGSGTPGAMAGSASGPAKAESALPTASLGPSPSSGQIEALSFEKLAGYTFEVSDELLGPVTNDVAAATEKTNAQIPAAVKAYDQKKVALRGFMLPLKVEGGLVTEMLIMKDQSMCCYGATPRINDWVSVKMKAKGVRPTMDLPVTLFGTMKVGEMRENGYLVGIYSMDGESMEAPVTE